MILPEGFCGKAQRPWHFKQLWLENSGCHDTVERAWRMVSSVISMTSVMTKIEACKQQLTQLSKLTICNVSKTLAEKKNLLKQVEAAAVRGRDVDVFLKLKFEIHNLLRLEEKLWQQRSHAHWMVSGDNNSKFFHNQATQRFRKNKISGL